jgi:hypothetical protein
MNFDYSEAEEYEVELDSIGTIEFDEIEQEDAAEVAQLIDAVRAARVWH